jgi:histidine triad (HIT) family protein
MENCLFCQIINHQIPAEIEFENENLIVIKDIHPKAPIHFLIIPKQHIPSINYLEKNHIDLIGDMFVTAKELAMSNQIADDGYRLIINTNLNAGQTVNHLHLHLIGGQKLKGMA